ncbi:MAG: biotin/lipoyl-binding protein, partial [Synergistaceae bacterium]
MNIKKTVSLKVMILLAAAAVLSGGAWYFLSGDKTAIEYRTAVARKTDLRSLIQATGTLSAVETVDVGTQISGTVKEVYIDYNSVVKKGQLIAEIDSATQAADVAQAEANLNSAKADLMNSSAVLMNA